MPHHQKNTSGAFALLSAVFFYWGLLTSINSALIPFFRTTFSLSWRDAMLVNVAFYLAPFVICFPASQWMNRVGYRRALTFALCLAFGGALVIAFSLWTTLFALCLAGIFILAMGVAAMQVVANPYVTRLGAPENAPGRLSLASSINSCGATLAPVLLAAVLALTVSASTTAIAGLYIGLMLAGLLLFFLLHTSRMHDFRDATLAQPGRWRYLWQQPQFRSGVAGIFVYVGVEVSLGTTLLSYLNEASLGGFSRATATSLVAFYWGGALIGRLLYGLCARYCHPRRMYSGCVTGAIVLTLAAIVLASRAGGYCLLIVGVMNSVLYPIIFSRTLSGLQDDAARISACLIMAGIGGGAIPFIQGMVIDIAGLKMSFLVPVCCYLFLLFNGARYSS